MKQNCFNHVFGSARIKDVFICPIKTWVNKNQILHYRTLTNRSNHTRTNQRKDFYGNFTR